MIKGIKCVEVPVSSMERSVDFYENSLGIKKEYEHPVWTSFDVRGTSLALAASGTKRGEKTEEICKSCSPCVFRLAARKADRDEEAPSATYVLYLEVENLDSTYEELSRKGVRFAAKPREQTWGGRTAVMLDPDRNILVLGQYE